MFIILFLSFCHSDIKDLQGLYGVATAVTIITVDVKADSLTFALVQLVYLLVAEQYRSLISLKGRLLHYGQISG